MKTFWKRSIDRTAVAGLIWIGIAVRHSNRLHPNFLAGRSDLLVAEAVSLRRQLESLSPARLSRC